MSSAYLMSMPILIYNLGAEMVYVLCSRLKAQQIARDKSCKVIHDVVSALFDKKFVFEIQKKQEIAKHSAIRQLFDKLVHSSIMRLNTSSMNKLFDLMLMSVKLQFLKIKFPEEIFQVTMNHLNSLIKILEENDEKLNENLIREVKDNISYVNKSYISLNPYEYAILRQTLLRFFQGKNVKVSIFIQDGIQSNSGVIFLNMDETAPPGVKLPGAVVKHNQNNYTYYLNLKLTPIYEANPCKERVDIITTELGANIYLAERKPIQESQTNLTEARSTSNMTANESNLTHTSPSNITNLDKNFSSSSNITSFNNTSNNSISNKTQPVSYLNDTTKRKENIENVKKEFGQLADLLNVNTAQEDQTFKLDLFKINNKRKSNFGNTDNEEDDNYIEIERVKDDKLDKIKGMFDDINLKENKEEVDDLLDLMDIAASK